MKIYWDDVAKFEFKKAIAYIKKDSPKNAEKVKQDILKKVMKASLAPEKIGPDKLKGNNDGSYKAFELHRYRIAIKIISEKNEMRIIRFRHTSMEPFEY